jgi:hypothetical protein
MTSYINNNNFTIQNFILVTGLSTAGVSALGMLYYNRKVNKLSTSNPSSHQSTELSTPENHQKIHNYLWRYNILKNSGILSSTVLVSLGLVKGAVFVYNRRK